MRINSNISKKISVFGNFGMGNLGNDSTLQAVLQNIRVYFPDADVNCICTGPETVAAFYHITTIPMHPLFVRSELFQNNFLSKIIRKLFIGIPLEIFRWFKAFNVLRNRDMLIVPGTQFLSDNLSGPFGCPYIAFKWAAASKIMRCKLVFLSVGVGPLSRALSRFFVKTALSFADYRSYRDEISRKYLLDIGFSSNGDPVYPDLAFSLILPTALGNPRKNDDPIVAMGVLDYWDQFSPERPKTPSKVYNRYLNKISLFVAWLLDNFSSVRFVIGDTACDPAVKKELIALLNKLETSNKKYQIINESIESVNQLVSQLYLSDIVVSPRFHNIVLGLLLNKPVISLSYHEKFNALMYNYGLNKYIINIDNLDIDLFCKTILELKNNIDKVKPTIKCKVDEFRQELNYQYRFVFNKLLLNVQNS